MVQQTFDIQQFQPFVGIPIEITTNWSTYNATLRHSEFGGYEFKVIGRPYTVQLTTVRSWRFANISD